MDIRTFFPPLKRKKLDNIPSESEEVACSSSVSSVAIDMDEIDHIDKVPRTSAATASCSNDFSHSSESSVVVVEECCNNLDLGRWVGRSSQMTTSQKMEMLKCCWTPDENYDFSKDATDLKRKFKFEWLKTYAPWLVYSKRQKGALCLYCVLFPPANIHGVLGSFIIKPFTRYHVMHETCKKHNFNQWHKVAVLAAKNFLEAEPVNIMLISGHKKIIEENKKIISAIISTIIFCGTHEISLRGKGQHEGNFEDLLRERIDAGDETMKKHFEMCKKNATYMSPQIQNELINLCGSVVKDAIVSDARKAYAYSVMADETCDISGKEQLSIGVRFFDEEMMAIREEFIGFVELKKMDAQTIANEIHTFIEDAGFDANKCVGQGYDGCSTMAGHIGGVQKIMQNWYKNALYFHCASHKLNLVVNDLNRVPQIRNSIGTVKDIINYFRESIVRRNYVPNIPALCETRWSHKYKSISIFYKNIESIIEGLHKLSEEGNASTRKTAFQLHCAATKSEFIICVELIAKYSALLEPVANALQSKSLNMLQCVDHVKRIITVIKEHRESADNLSQEILSSANKTAEKIGMELQIPRIAKNQRHRSNPPASTPSEYWKRSIIIPYLDSLILSLEQRFTNDNLPAFSLLSLHPSVMLEMSIEEFKRNAQCFCAFYSLDNFSSEGELWYELWREKKSNLRSLNEIIMEDLVKEATLFFPETKKALLISLSQPCTTSTIERSFSTLRRVKTWSRSTMKDDRLNGLCMLSVHRKLVQERGNEIKNQVLEKFIYDKRKMMLI